MLDMAKKAAADMRDEKLARPGQYQERRDWNTG